MAPSREMSKNPSSLLHQNLQLLRSITNSNAVNRSSIIVDASNYIQQLKHKIHKLQQNHHDVIQSSSPDHHQFSSSSSINHETSNGLPMVTVESLEKKKKGFLINIMSEKNCPGLLVSVLEAFEELGLDVVEARVSCSDDSFRLQAVGGRDGDDQNEEVIKEAVLQAINGWDG